MKDRPEKPFKIAMLGHKRVPSREGGVEVVVEQLSARMAQMGHQVTCYNRWGRHVAGREFAEKPGKEYRGIRLKTVPTLDKKGLAAVTSSFFGSLAAALGDYDVVHYHAEGPCAMLWLPRLFGKRCIATIHGLDWDREKWRHGFASRYIRFGERMAAKYAHEIIVLSPSVQDYFDKTYGRPTRCIPNGVEPMEKIPPKEITQRYGLGKEDYILFLGRLVPEKGLECLIGAYRMLNTGKKLVIAGGLSDSAAFLEKLEKLADGDDRILFTGFVQGRILAELYSNAYVYVLPSDLEGMPLSLLEAMSFGNCCLVSDIPECANVVGQRGMTFPKGDAQALRDCLRILCDSPELVEYYRMHSADGLRERYNWDEIVRKTLALYDGHDRGR